MKNSYEIIGNDVYITVKNKTEEYKTVINFSDLENVLLYPNLWHASKDVVTGKYYVTGAIQRDGKRTRLSLHRWIMGNPVGFHVDHRNQDTLDNKRSNLRLVNHSGNAQNRTNISKSNTSGYRGVNFHKPSKKWIASVKINGKRQHIGCFNDVHEAGKAAEEARKELMPFYGG